MIVLKERPPNYKFIVKAFPAVEHMQGVLFTYGDVIYNPNGVAISKSLQIHEEVHAKRQLDFNVKKHEIFEYLMAESYSYKSDDLKVGEWWLKYLTDKMFRLEEELLAHQAEYEAEASVADGRRRRQFCLKYMAKRLSSPMYGSMVDFKKAKRLIKGE